MIATRRRSLARELWRHRAHYLAISPFYVLFAAFGFFPLIYSVMLSFNEWTGSGPWRPVGIDNLSAAIGEERDTIEDVLEPFLIQQGFLQRTNRGRIATTLSYRHFGIVPPAAAGQLFASE